MKAKNMIRGLLPMAAALMLTACSSDDIIEVNNAVPETTTIPFSVTVNQGDVTRVGVGDDMKTLYFTAGDKLYISSDERTDITGTLTLKDGDENKSTVTFEGAITYTTAEGEPDGTITIIADTMDPNASPVVALQSNVAAAVATYSNLTGTSTYASRSFTLQQQVAFLNFEVTFTDGTTTDNSLKFAIINDPGTSSEAVLVQELSLPTHAAGSTTAKFVVPIDATTGLVNAVLRITKTDGGNKYTDKLIAASKTLLGKVYNVSRTVASGDWAAITARNAADVTDGDKGKLICTSGHIHTYGMDSWCTATRVAKIIYVSANTHHATYNHGVALALADESGTMNWTTAKATAEGHTPAVTNAAWMLPDWENLAAAAGGYTNLRTGFTSVGGTNLKVDNYWDYYDYGGGSQAEYDYFLDAEKPALEGGPAPGNKSESYNVRAALVF